MAEEEKEKPKPEELISDLKIATLSLIEHKEERTKRLDYLESLEILYNLIGSPLGPKQKSELQKIYNHLVEEGPDLFTEEELLGKIEPVVLEPIQKALFPSKDL